VPRIGATRTGIRGDHLADQDPVGEPIGTARAYEIGRFDRPASGGALYERSGRASQAAWKDLEQVEANRPRPGRRMLGELSCRAAGAVGYPGAKDSAVRARTKGRWGGKLPVGNDAFRSPAFNLSAAMRKALTKRA
jgi:hypothetical protein